MRVPILLAAAFAALAALPAAAQQVPIGSGSVVETIAKLKPGEYVWAAEAAPNGPVQLVVNLKTQRATLFRNGVPIGASTVSTGRPGYSTPTGVFTILQKRVEHYSSTYDNAPMPFMQRLTWQGVALHAGNLPGYPASHGCIRFPLEFARLLYGVTHLGMTVIVTNSGTVARIADGALIESAPDIAFTPGAVDWYPERSPEGPLSIVVSVADGRATVLRNGIVIGSGPVAVQGPIRGTWAYALRSGEGGKPQWVQLDLDSDDTSQVEPAEWRRFHAPERFRALVASVLVPGTTVIVTRDSLKHGPTGSAVTVLEAEPPRE